METTTQTVRVIDSHTGGEPTRVVVDGGPDLGVGSPAELRERFRADHDDFRSAVVNEPRGSDAVVGALLIPPTDHHCVAGVIFFNNVGCLGMCVHGTIGLVVTLGYMGRIRPGIHRLETPVGVVTAELHAAHDVSVTNVHCFRHRTRVSVEVSGWGRVTGDVAWGGNWFFLSEDHGLDVHPGNLDALTDRGWAIRQSLRRTGVTGASGEEIDHIELFGPPRRRDADSKNFVLCPGKAYDRSPCGTGTSAKLACLHADGKLREGETWRQEGIVGSVFQGSVRVVEGAVFPTIRGSAHVTAESKLILDAADPFRTGIRG